MELNWSSRNSYSFYHTNTQIAFLGTKSEVDKKLTNKNLLYYT